MAGLQALAVTAVLVHGGFVDGAGWEGVYNQLKKDGYDVSVVQNPTTSLEDDVAATRRAIAQAKGPVVLVGHSYGGVVITEAGNDPKVAGLVYIAAFAPDRAKFAASFAADVDAPKAQFMADSQVPWGLNALNGAVSEPAWKTKQSWYLVATDDKMIPPAAQRFMAGRAGAKVEEAAGSHAIYVSKPAVVAAFIEKAASGAQ
jgi:pimeloyl-ACP methyl ester carboxylesterase